MTERHSPSARSQVRIRAGTRVFGAGLLVADNLVCTCAHVVAEALGVSPRAEDLPSGKVTLDFPFLGASVSASVVRWVPVAGIGSGDLALLRTDSLPPAGSFPARLLSAPLNEIKNFKAFGYPDGRDDGQWSYGRIRGAIPEPGWVQIEKDADGAYAVTQGYSGTAVWDLQDRGVIGIVVATDFGASGSAAFVIPSDIVQQTFPDLPLRSAARPFAALTAGLDGLPGSPLTGIEQFLYEYVGSIKSPVPFGGRDEQLLDMDAWLTGGDKPYMLLTAEAGRGKSALLSRWALELADQARAAVAFVPISIRFGTARTEVSFSAIGARLRAVTGIGRDVALPEDPRAWLAEIETILRTDQPLDRPLLIVLDGIDEAVGWECGVDLRLPPHPGQNVRVLASARLLANRNDSGWERQLEWHDKCRRMSLPPLTREAVGQILESMGDPLAALASNVDFRSELHRLSEGDPLLIRLYVEALRGVGQDACFVGPDDLAALKPGLAAYFDRWWESQVRQWGLTDPTHHKTVQALIALLARALGPLRIDELVELCGNETTSRLDVEAALVPLRRFVVGDGRDRGYVFSHPRLASYFGEEKLSRAERDRWDNRFLDFGRDTVQALNETRMSADRVPTYVLQHYGAHLERAGRPTDEYNALICEPWLRAWEQHERGFAGFLVDVSRAWRVATATLTDRKDRSGDASADRLLAMQVKCAAIVGSTVSIARGLPVPLLTALVANGVWAPAHGLFYARSVPDETQRANALVQLAEYLPLVLLHEAVEAATSLKGHIERARVLTLLASLLPLEEREGACVEALRALAAVEGMKGLREAPYIAADIMQVLAPLLPARLSSGTRITDLLRKRRPPHWNKFDLHRNDGALVTYPRSKERLEEFVRQYQAIGDLIQQVNALAAMCVHIRDEDKEWTASIAVGVLARAPESLGKFRATERLAAVVPASLAGALAGIARSLGSAESRCRVFTSLTSNAPTHERSSYLSEALDALDQLPHKNRWTKAMLAARLAAVAPEGYRRAVADRALAMSAGIRLPEYRARVELELVSARAANEPDGTTVPIDVPGVLGTISAVQPSNTRFALLYELVKRLPPDSRGGVVSVCLDNLESARGEALAEGLAEVAFALSSEQLVRATRLAASIGNTRARARVLESLHERGQLLGDEPPPVDYREVLDSIGNKRRRTEVGLRMGMPTSPETDATVRREVPRLLRSAQVGDAKFWDGVALARYLGAAERQGVVDYCLSLCRRAHTTTARLSRSLDVLHVTVGQPG